MLWTERKEKSANNLSYMWNYRDTELVDKFPGAANTLENVPTYSRFRLKVNLR